jgi:uncharacterized OB-fold protein
MSVSEPVMTLYDRPMWESIGRHAMALPRCRGCGTSRYPPGPACPHCLSLDYDWVPVSGRGTVMSWVVFHRKYFDDFPPPYNAAAIELEEGPIIVTNLVGDEPAAGWIGAAVELFYVERGGRTVHQARLRGEILQDGA